MFCQQPQMVKVSASKLYTLNCKLTMKKYLFRNNGYEFRYLPIERFAIFRNPILDDRGHNIWHREMEGLPQPPSLIKSPKPLKTEILFFYLKLKCRPKCIYALQQIVTFLLDYIHVQIAIVVKAAFKDKLLTEFKMFIFNLLETYFVEVKKQNLTFRIRRKR